MEKYLKVLATVCFGVIAVGSFIFGPVRGNHTKKVNATVIHFFVSFMTLWYALSAWGSFGVADFVRDDGTFDIPLLHYVSSVTIMMTFTALVSYKLKQNSLGVVWYSLFCLFAGVSMLLGVFLYESGDRKTWTVISVVATVMLVVNTVKNSSEEEIGSHAFVRAVIVLVMLYIGVYTCFTLMGPLHQNVISFSTQDIVLTVADLLVSLLCGLPIVHFGWALNHKKASTRDKNSIWMYVSKLIQPAAIREYNGSFLNTVAGNPSVENLIDVLHTYN